MKQYELWDDIPNGVTVYVPEHNLLAIKLENAKLVAITEHGGRLGWMQTTGRHRGPFEDVYGKLAPLKDCAVPKPEPRQWNSIVNVPKDVRVRDCVGDKWKYESGYWWFKDEGIWWEADLELSIYSGYGPFTEIVK